MDLVGKAMRILGFHVPTRIGVGDWDVARDICYWLVQWCPAHIYLYCVNGYCRTLVGVLELCKLQESIHVHWIEGDPKPPQRGANASASLHVVYAVVFKLPAVGKSWLKFIFTKWQPRLCCFTFKQTKWKLVSLLTFLLFRLQSVWGGGEAFPALRKVLCHLWQRGKNLEHLRVSGEVYSQLVMTRVGQWA